MHELGILRQIMKTVERVIAENGASVKDIDTIILEVGEISGVLPKYIEECYPAAIYKTEFEHVKLKVDIVEGVVKCNDCGEEFNAMKWNLRCPKCKGEHLEAKSGREFLIKEVLIR